MDQRVALMGASDQCSWRTIGSAITLYFYWTWTPFLSAACRIKWRGRWLSVAALWTCFVWVVCSDGITYWLWERDFGCGYDVMKPRCDLCNNGMMCVEYSSEADYYCESIVNPKLPVCAVSDTTIISTMYNHTVSFWLWMLFVHKKISGAHWWWITNTMEE